MMEEKKQKRKIIGAKNYLYIVEPNVNKDNEDNVWEGSLKSLKNKIKDSKNELKGDM